MNYTKFVREYCKNNSGAFFDVSKLKDAEFSEVPYKTLLKILNRLEEEGLLKPVSKGVYFIGEKPVDEELVFDEYVDDGKGMFVGYQLFNDVGVREVCPTFYHHPKKYFLGFFKTGILSVTVWLRLFYT